jgi:DNA gyrase subunit A
MKPSERIIDIDVSDEMRDSFLEYSYSVIYSRALPDARDGLKPVQRRIVYQMGEMGLRPDRGHVKCARVTGEVMGKLHPHGDGAIYDALVRMSQSFTLRLPLIDGHGNFGSLDDGPAAARYTEARLTPAAMLMNESLDEDVVDFEPNYDAQLNEPAVLPAAFPNLLVNGASGIAVGMATNMPPHNLREVVRALELVAANPECSVDDVMQVLPAPDLPGGGQLVLSDGLREAYETGRGSFKMRSSVSIETVSPRRLGIVVTELPYLVGPERVIEKIRDGVNSKKLTGIANVVDLTDRENGLRLIIELKSGFDPDAVLLSLFRHTPLEENFSVNNVALVSGRPKQLGLIELLKVYLDHRIEVVTRRSKSRLDRKSARLHLLDGLRIAVLNIDEVIEVIRTSDTADDARLRLISVFDLSQLQAEYILELRLRRLTKFSVLELDQEADQLRLEIAELKQILSDSTRLRSIVLHELAEVAKAHGDERRTTLVADDGQVVSKTPVATELVDAPATVSISPSGRLLRGSAPVSGWVNLETSLRSDLALVTRQGQALRIHCSDLPPVSAEQAPTTDEIAGLPPGSVVAVLPWSGPNATIAVATALGTVKRISAELPDRESVEIIALRDGDTLVSAALAQDSDRLCLITSEANLLIFTADQVRPQGLPAGGMAGIKLQAGRVVGFGVARYGAEPTLVTAANGSASLLGTDAGSIKITPISAYPEKGRATQGVRCHKFLKGEDQLYFAAVADLGNLVDIDERPILEISIDPRRDASGTKVATAIFGAN